jgi:hypothetical protein
MIKKANKFWILTAVFGFASFISFFQIDGDKGEGLWVVSGVLCGLAALYSIYQVSKNTGGGGSQER